MSEVQKPDYAVSEKSITSWANFDKLVPYKIKEQSYILSE